MATTVAISVKIGQYSELFVIFVRNVPTGGALYNGRMASMVTKQDFMLYPIGMWTKPNRYTGLYLRANIIS